MISLGVEISIAGGGGDMVVPISWSFSVVFFFFCNHAFIVSMYK